MLSNVEALFAAKVPKLEFAVGHRPPTQAQIDAAREETSVVAKHQFLFHATIYMFMAIGIVGVGVTFGFLSVMPFLPAATVKSFVAVGIVITLLPIITFGRIPPYLAAPLFLMGCTTSLYAAVMSSNGTTEMYALFGEAFQFFISNLHFVIPVIVIVNIAATLSSAFADLLSGIDDSRKALQPASPDLCPDILAWSNADQSIASYCAQVTSERQFVVGDVSALRMWIESADDRQRAQQVQQACQELYSGSPSSPA